MADGEDNDVEDLDDAPVLRARSENLAKSKKIRDKLEDLYKDVEKGFDDQMPRSTDIMDYWDIYNCKLGAKQFYSGNAAIFVPIVYEAVTARVTRFANQVFPQSGRYVECTSSDGTLPQATMSLAEHYVRKARLRSLIPALLLNGDVEGQYTVYVYWDTNTRHVVQKVKAPVQAEPGLEAAEDPVDDIEELEIKAEHPMIEIISDADFLVMPGTADTLTEALQAGGSVTILRRWGKAKLQSLADEGQIDRKIADELCEEMAKDNTSMRPDKEKGMVSAAGVKSDGRGKFILVYETWSIVKTPDGQRLCRTFFGGDKRVLACHRNPNWSDRLPIISEPVKKVQGAFKGRSLVASVDTLQYYANDIMNEAADSATYSLMPIIMTDPEKNPRIGSMVLSLAAVWQTSPKDTEFAKFPDLWKDGLEIVAAVKQEIFQALSVNPAAITHGSKKKMSQAEVANEQQVDLLTTSDAVTVLEEGVLSPIVKMFMELDHQYRDDAIMVRSYGDMGKRADMEKIEPLQMNKRYELRWFGVEAARNTQQVQQQIAGMNVLKGIDPKMYPGYKLNLAPAIVQLVENTFGPRLGPLIFEDLKSQLAVDPKMEVELATQGVEMPVHPLGDHQEAMKLLMKALQETHDPHGTIRAQIMKHQKILMEMAQAQAQQMTQGGQQGSPGGGGQPGAAGTPKPGAQPMPPRGGQQPPGTIHQDRMPLTMPRKMG